jgi:glycosyltransferase involved in cell wall biosynthesis
VTQSGSTLVCVVVPAYNAAGTLDETLRSVRSQTHRALEIVVVDDGSLDDTGDVARRHASEDDRVRVLRQLNAGVAAARNAGWQSSQANLIAFIDADDLWAPTKIERQLQALEEAGPQVGLVYCWTARLREDGTILGYHGGVRHDGHALSTIVRSNYIGSGSNVLVRRQSLVEVGGFDTRLHGAGAQGCEDWLLSCLVAQKYHFACVPEYLVGYRFRHNGMSRNRMQMIRSHLLMCDRLLASRPDMRAAILGGVQAYCVWLMRDAMSTSAWRQLGPLWLTTWHKHPQVALRVMWRELLLDPARLVRDRMRRPAVALPDDTKGRRRFLESLANPLP